MHAELVDGVLWGRMVVQEAKAAAAGQRGGGGVPLCSAANTIFFAHFPGSPYVLVTALKKEFRDYIFQSLLAISGGSKVGRPPFSLLC
jgi:hypothetical protein